jgi:2-amino-4-hydroxy-6-hydroxymethyldihydropteridine diphosphokinase
LGLFRYLAFGVQGPTSGIDPQNAIYHRITKHNVRFQACIFVGLGSNAKGAWGIPEHTLRRALHELEVRKIKIIYTSKLYVTQAHAYIPQPDYLNAVVQVATSLTPGALLQVLKRIEAQAGRSKPKSGLQPYFRWMPRPLDLDIVSYRGIVHNWTGRHPATNASLILPHPRAHERAFVLRPLSEIAPFWHHPVLGLTAAELLKRPAVRDLGKIRSVQEFLPC